MQRLTGAPPPGPFFSDVVSPPPAGARARQSWRREHVYFGLHSFSREGIPDLHRNPFHNDARAKDDAPWYELADFDSTVGDIKCIWEPSRLDWLLAFAQRAAQGEPGELERLNTWLSDWARNNPPYFGANWKCGQEAAIRVMHFAAAAMVLGQVHRPTPGLRSLLRLHLERIAPTIHYALGQQNNHATSEAAALFIGGTWLATFGEARAQSWQRLGRRWLERCAHDLIESDGTFSQYSVNYHRVMLDTYSLVEVWRRQLGLPGFSAKPLSRLRAATRWLYQMVDPATGDAPNLGANDGARLLPLVDSDYRDYRPSLQLATTLFLGARALRSSGSWDQPLIWLRVAPAPETLGAPASTSFQSGGFFVLRRGHAAAYLRCPGYRFRPSQPDALHLDFWLAGHNILRDAGSYSYNAPAELLRHFDGTEAHNTVQFDGRDQMPRISRFLFGAWLKPRGMEPIRTRHGADVAAAGYRDAWGAEHHRRVSLSERTLRCVDRVAGQARSATLRWRLQPGDWTLSGQTARNGDLRLSVSIEPRAGRASLVQGKESRYYLSSEPLPVLEVELPVPSLVTTTLTF